MFLRVIAGFLGFVVMNGPVFLMVVMLDALVVFELVPDLMGQGCRASNRRQAALHGKAIQGQAQQEKDMDNAAQNSSR